MSSKKGLFSKATQNIGVPQRIGIIVSVVAIGAASVYMYNSFGNDNSNTAVLAGKASLSFAPKERDIGKTKPGEEINLPKDSQLLKKLEQGRLDKIQEIKNDEQSSSSYIQQLRLVNTAKKEAQLKAEAEANPQQRVQTGLTKIMEKRARERQVKQAKQAISNPQRNPVKQGPVLTRSMILNAYLQEELAEQKLDESIFNQRMDTVSTMMNEQKSPLYFAPNINSKDNSGNSEPIQNGGANISYSNIPDDANQEANPSDGVEFEVLPGEEFFALLDDQINTDQIQTIMARVLDGGRFHGANLIGGIDNHGETVSLIFNTMTFEGKVYSINAVAFDLETDSMAMSDYTDNHIFERYGSLALASFLEGYANALSGTTTTTNATGTTTTTTNPLPNAGDQLKVAIGNIGGTFVPVLQNKFERPPTVHVNTGRVLGIRIVEPFNI